MFCSDQNISAQRHGGPFAWCRSTSAAMVPAIRPRDSAAHVAGTAAGGQGRSDVLLARPGQRPVAGLAVRAGLPARRRTRAHLGRAFATRPGETGHVDDPLAESGQR